MGRNSQTVLVGLAIALSIPAAAAAQSRRAQAVKHFEQGEAYFLAGAFDKAVVEYQSAYDLVPKPALLFNIGLAYENMGDAEHAIESYQRYLTEDPKGPKVAEARARSEAIVRRRQAEQERSEREAREQARRDAEAREQARRDAEAREQARRDAERAARDAGVAEQPLPPTPTPVEHGARPSLLPGLIVVGGGALLAGVGLAYHLKAGNIRDELEQELETGTPPLDSNDPRLDDGDSAAFRRTVLFGLGGAAFVVGTVLVVRALVSDPEVGGVAIVPSAGPDHAGVGLELTW